RDPAALAGLMHVQGDAALAQVVSDLARDLRWDIEDDLSRVVGDVAATRLTSTARGAVAAASETAQRFMGNTAEYLSEESGMLVSRPVFEHWQAQLASLQGRLAELEQRITRLPRAQTAAGGNTSGNTQRPVGPVYKS